LTGQIVVFIFQPSSDELWPCVSAYSQLSRARMINQINPEKVYPVHTENQQLFKTLETPVQIVEKGKRYNLQKNSFARARVAERLGQTLSTSRKDASWLVSRARNSITSKIMIVQFFRFLVDQIFRHNMHIYVGNLKVREVLLHVR